MPGFPSERSVVPVVRINDTGRADELRAAAGEVRTVSTGLAAA